MCRYLQIDRRAASKLVRSIVDRGFAVEVQLKDHPGAPHLCRISNRQIYRALGAENIRYRRVVKARVTFLRVLGLDYILEHPTYHWLPTEHDKVDFFHSKLNVPTHLLPSRVYKGTAGNQQRFFVSKYPIAHEKNTVTFLYIDPHDLTDKPLRLWLSDHRSLFDALRHAGKRIRVVAVASERKILARADRLLSPWSQAQPVPHQASADTDELNNITRALNIRRHPDLAAVGRGRRSFQTNERDQKTVIPRGRGPQGSGHRYRYIPDRQPLALAFHSPHRHRF